jgi:predicted hotdog family 3-hydroxylacyl-ACP dehydratase
MAERIDLQALIPHQGAMCLNEHIASYDDDQVVLSTRTHLQPDHPLRSKRGLRALHLCEYGAQAMAVHGGLLARASGQRAAPGLLVAVRNVSLHVQYLDHLDGALQVTARRLVATHDSWQYEFSVCFGAALLATGRAAVMLRRE